VNKATRIGLFGLALFGAIAVIGLPGRNEEEDSTESAGKEAAPAPVGKLDMDVISMGEEVDIEAHLQPGVTTLIEFTAEW